MKKIFIISIIVLQANLILAQGEKDTAVQIFYRNENSLALLLNSNGLGFNYRYGRRVDAKRKNIFDIEAVWIKHPKEVKITDLYYNKFVFGKLNSFYNIRLGIGRQKEMFEKYDIGGIALILFYQTGLSIGLLKPIYYEYYDVARRESYLMKFEDNIIFRYFTVNQAPFEEGLDETKLVLGGFAKLGLQFDFGKKNKYLNAFEIGTTIDVMSKKIEIMATEDNNQVFLSLFLAIRIGKIREGRY